jgi:type II secretory pathway pseudopilin PulG
MEVFCVLGFLVALAAIVWAIMSDADKQERAAKALKELEQKREAYQTALSQLRDNPTNPTLHEQALLRGRDYAAATRGNGSVTLFDETALANDIRAVTANATQTAPVVSQVATTATPSSLESRINALKKMKENGLLTDAEFDQKRQEILDSI